MSKVTRNNGRRLLFFAGWPATNASVAVRLWPIDAVIDGPFDATTRAFHYLRNVHRRRDQTRRSNARTFYADCT